MNRFQSRIRRALHNSVALPNILKLALLLIVLWASSLGLNVGDTDIVKTVGFKEVTPLVNASRVQLDSRTGEILQIPTKAGRLSLELTPSLENSLSSATNGLRVENGAGGGKMVQLQGRFRHLSAASAGEGSVETVKCFDGAASTDPDGGGE